MLRKILEIAYNIMITKVSCWSNLLAEMQGENGGHKIILYSAFTIVLTEENA